MFGTAADQPGQLELKFLKKYTGRNGIPFALSVVPVEQLRVCAALAAREGLDEQQALEAITINAASIIGVADRLGSITAGKRADLAIFDGHPLDFRSRLVKVMVDGLLWGDNNE